MKTILFGASSIAVEVIRRQGNDDYIVVDSFYKGDFCGYKVRKPQQLLDFIKIKRIIVCSITSLDQISAFLKMIGIQESVIFCANEQGEICSLSKVESFRKKGILVVTCPKSGSIWVDRTLRLAARNFHEKRHDMMYTKFDSVRHFDPHQIGRLAKDGGIQLGFYPYHEFTGRLLADLVDEHALKIIIHARDPRQALLSWIYYMDETVRAIPLRQEHFGLSDEYFRLTFDEKVCYQIDHQFASYLRWLNGWMQFKQSPVGEKCLLVTHELLSTDPSQYTVEVCRFLQVSPDFLNFARPRVKGKFNFRSGKVDEWKSVFNAELQRRMQNKIEEFNMCSVIENLFGERV